jgi:dTDP-glucose 4,6-dehydratase
MKILVTGGCGFIGSNFIRFILGNAKNEVINLDALTYAGNKENLRDFEGDDRYTFIKGRIEDGELVNKVLKNVDYVVNFAAETHVDRSIDSPMPFSTTNVIGTQVLLEACRELNIKKFIHISTDEVYGSLENDEGKFTEGSPLRPNSPYAASKASADLLVRAYFITYDLPVVIVRPSNNYGYYQFPEKFIPLAITNLLEDKPIPIYGDGKNIRDWIFVEDCVKGIYEVLRKGKEGEVYNLGGGNEWRNIDVARFILKIMNKDETYLKFVKDRPSHDYRYALDNSKIIREIGWRPKISFEEGLRKTVEWYRNNDWWWKPLKARLNRESKGFWGS